MNAFAQVWHLLKKDLVSLRWPLGLYALSVIVLVLHAIGVPKLQGDVFPLLGVLTQLALLFILAGAIQADAPSSPVAFWASRPFDRTAVAVGKIVLLVALLTFATVAETIALTSFSVNASRALELALLAARATLVFATTAMLLGALTQSIGRLLVGGLAVVVTSTLIAILIPPFSRGGYMVGVSFELTATDAASPAMLLYAIACVLFQLGVLVWLYHVRDRRALALAVGTLAVLLPWWQPSRLGRAQAPVREVASTVSRPPWSVLPPGRSKDLRIERFLLATDDSVGSPLVTGVARATGLPSNMQLTLDPVEATLVLRDGRRVRLSREHVFANPTNLSAAEGSTPPALPTIPGLAWVVRSADSATFEVTASFADLEPAIKRTDVLRLEVDARSMVYEAVVDTLLPVATSARIERTGWSATIVRWNVTDDRAAIVLDTRGVELSDASLAPLMYSQRRSRSYALVDERRQSGVPLYPAEAMSNTQAHPLLGIESFASRGTLRTRQPTDSANNPSDRPSFRAESWQRGATLAIIRLEARGSYPVHLEFPMER